MQRVLGVVRMANAVSPWRALRPVLLAGAATLTWLTFSSPAASADALPDGSSLLGGVTSSVSSVTDKLVGTAPNAPAPAAHAPSSPGAPSAGPLQPVVGQVSGIADNLVSAVPVVNQMVPSGTVTSIAAPIAQLADGTTAAVVEVVVPPVAEALPVLEPVLDPVSDLVTGAAPLPVELPELVPAAVAGEVPPAAAALVTTEASASAEQAGADALTPSESSVTEAPHTAATLQGAVVMAGTSAPPGAAISAPDSSHEQPGTADPSPAPAQAPPAPGSGTGSGAASAGSPGSAAFVSSFDFVLPLPGALCAGEAPEHAPAPVSFDPGSSPD
ncbi:MAG: hypothetical protein JWQ56_2924 [Pseudarthrobacter sp.]|nr:hypothetical protein [Pseudarthrobacter sp.]